MKKLTTLILGSCLFNTILAQSIGINNDGSAPHPSAVLDLKSINKGILMPRVSLINIVDSSTISHPAKSLVVFNTNPQIESGLGLYIWTGNQWQLIVSAGNEFIKGENRYTTIVDSVQREYFVSVPDAYNDSVKSPVVMVLHGSGSNGKGFSNTSGWKDVGEEENIITVFPSSRSLHIIKDSAAKHITKWNAYPDVEWNFFPGTSGQNDIKFFKTIITELRAKFNIDTSRIYLEGFSSGGQMASRCAIEMSDIFAAVVSNAASFYLDTVYIPKRKLPVMFQVGNKDYGPGVPGPEVPLSFFETTLNNPNSRNGFVARAHVRNFSLNPVYTVTGDTNSVRIATYHSLIPGDTLNIFKFVIIKELGHTYPNGENFIPSYSDHLNILACRDHWDWFKQYRKP